MDVLTKSQSELISKLRESSRNEKNILNIVDELIKFFTSIEDSNNFNSVQANCLLLLFCLKGEFEKCNIRKPLYKVINIYNKRIEESIQTQKNFVIFFLLVKN